MSIIKKRQQLKSATAERHVINILAAVAHNPHVSTRQLEYQSGISQQSVLLINISTNFTQTHITSSGAPW